MKEIKINRRRGLINAALHNDTDAVKYWVEVKHISVTKTNANKQTAAHLAAQNDNLDILEYLLHRDSEKFLIRAKDNKGLTIFHTAARQGNVNIVKYLADEHLMDADELFQRVKVFPGNNAVHLAAENGHMDVLKYLVKEKHGEVNVQNDFKESPLFLAVQGRHLNVVQYLVTECSANVFLTDKSGNSILHVATLKGDLNIIKYLLEDRQIMLDVNAKNNDGEACLHRAVSFDNFDIVKYFIYEKYADINICDKTNRTPLYQAAIFGRVEMVKWLVEHKADPEIADTAGFKPINITACVPVIDYLKKISRKRNRRNADYSFSQATPIISTWVNGVTFATINPSYCDFFMRMRLG